MKIIHILKLTTVLFVLLLSKSFLQAQDCDPDVQGPILNCNALTEVEVSDTEEAIITAEMILDMATDNCDETENLQLFINIATGYPNDFQDSSPVVLPPGTMGNIQLEVWALDSANNWGLCWGAVQVGVADDCENDNTSPVAVCEDIVSITSGTPTVVTVTAANFNDGSYDNCTLYGDLEFNVTLDETLTSPPSTTSVSFTESGSYVSYLWVTDASVNASVCAVNTFINIPDNCNSDVTPPVAICDANWFIDVEPGDEFTISASDLDDGSIDNCTSTEDLGIFITTSADTSIPPTTTTVVFDGDNSGTTLVYLWVIDEAGNSNICVIEVVLNYTPPSCNPDETAPIIVCTETLTVTTVTNEDFVVEPDMTVISGADFCTISEDLQFFITTSETQGDPPTTQILTFPYDSENTTIYSFAIDEAGNYSFCSTEVVFEILQGVSGKIFVDSNENCQLDADEEGIGGYTVRYTLDQGLTYTEASPSDASGNYNMLFDVQPTAGELTIELLMPNGLGNSCVTSYTYTTPLTDFEILDFPVQLVTDCDYMHTDISAPFLRRCFPTPYTVSYCNYSTEAVDNVELTVTLDPAMVIGEVSLPYTDLGNNILLFELETVESGDCGLINLEVVLDCNTPLGATKCVQASISPNECNDPGLNWSGASLIVNGECDEEAGKVNFNITNEGTGTMATPLAFIVVEDVVMYMQTPIQLGPNESEPLEFDANGSTWRVAIEQEAGHPSLSSPTAFVEGCGGYGSTGMANQFAMDDLDPFISIDCQEVIAAFDPNDKRAFPEGYSDQHFIEPNTSIEYNIRFQNTGTDTAFTVRIEDRLSSLLDETSVEAGASSHSYRMEVQDDGLLIFHFENIMLPDSNVNEVASHGFVQFRVNQKPDNQLGMVIENTAEIYFDFNEEIVTNTVSHTLGMNFIISETNEVFVPNLDLIVAPNPFHSQATFTLNGVDINEGTIELYDVFGRMVKQDTFSGNQYELNRESLPIGTYFFRFLDKNRLLVNGKIMVK